MRYSNAKTTLHISLRSMLLVVMTIAFACVFPTASTAAELLPPVVAVVALFLFATTFMLTAASLADDLWEDPGINFVAAILGMFAFPFVLPLLWLMAK